MEVTFDLKVGKNGETWQKKNMPEYFRINYCRTVDNYTAAVESEKESKTCIIRSKKEKPYY